MSDFLSQKIFNVPAFNQAFSASGLPLAQTTTAQTSNAQISEQQQPSNGETSMISDLGLILVVAGIATVLFKRLKQPVVLGYILAGFLVGPHFGYFPTVVDEANIDFWAELGIIFLLFSLGLEFSFKKLLNVGGSAAVTVLVIVVGMMATGYTAGRMMDFTNISSLFLGAMLSMSSTTIIMKALSDLNMSHRRFTPQVLAVLIVEDLFAVILMVVLSSIAVNNSVSGEDLLWSVFKLSFFLILWFLVGVYIIPTFLKRQRRFLTNELLLVLCIGLCFLMVIASTYSGFSSALGAFVMGSILAGTSEAERMSRVVAPVKDLFGAIFFVSVGMMVDPQVLSTYTVPILILSAIVIVGMIVFGTGGMLITGQPLRIAIESGFSLVQIGEFSFIIATRCDQQNAVSDNRVGVGNNNVLHPIFHKIRRPRRPLGGKASAGTLACSHRALQPVADTQRVGGDAALETGFAAHDMAVADLLRGARCNLTAVGASAGTADGVVYEYRNGKSVHRGHHPRGNGAIPACALLSEHQEMGTHKTEKQRAFQRAVHSHATCAYRHRFQLLGLFSVHVLLPHSCNLHRRGTVRAGTDIFLKVGKETHELHRECVYRQPQRAGVAAQRTQQQPCQRHAPRLCQRGLQLPVCG
jgi:Kef-type K+ transport system membrane component KefB